MIGDTTSSGKDELGRSKLYVLVEGRTAPRRGYSLHAPRTEGPQVLLGELGVFARGPELISRQDAKIAKEDKEGVAMRRGAMGAASGIGH